MWHFGLIAASALVIVVGAGFRSSARPVSRPVVTPEAQVTPQSLAASLLKYDRNHDGRVTLDELPNGMRPLVEMGDGGRDGALDADEILQLARRVSQDYARGLILPARIAPVAPPSHAPTSNGRTHVA
jgi:hypothetical protein